MQRDVSRITSWEGEGTSSIERKLGEGREGGEGMNNM
jgi:hypothetical protein